MSSKRTRALFSALAIFLTAWALPAKEQPNTLTLEVASPSLTSDFGGESPPGTGVRFAGQLEGDDPLVGLSFDLRLTRYFGLRLGLLRGSLPLAAEGDCEPAPCEFMAGNATVIISEANWSVVDESSFSMPFVDLAFFAQPSPKVQLFAGPTLAFLQLGDVEAGGLEGLIVRPSVESVSYGLHAGGTVDIGWKRDWLVGLVVRAIQTKTDYTIQQPTLAPINELFSSEDDLVTVSLMVGRRFSGAGR